MEEKLNAESQSLEDELVRKMEHPECVQARGAFLFLALR